MKRRAVLPVPRPTESTYWRISKRKLSTSVFFPEKVDGFDNFNSRGTSVGRLLEAPPAPSPRPTPPSKPSRAWTRTGDTSSCAGNPKARCCYCYYYCYCYCPKIVYSSDKEPRQKIPYSTPRDCNSNAATRACNSSNSAYSAALLSSLPVTLRKSSCKVTCA